MAPLVDLSVSSSSTTSDSSAITILLGILATTSAIGIILLSSMVCACCAKKSQPYDANQATGGAKIGATQEEAITKAEENVKSERLSGSSRGGSEKSRMRKQEVIANALLDILKTVPTKNPAGKKGVPGGKTTTGSLTTPTIAKMNASSVASEPKPFVVAKTVMTPSQPTSAAEKLSEQQQQVTPKKQMVPTLVPVPQSKDNETMAMADSKVFDEGKSPNRIKKNVAASPIQPKPFQKKKAVGPDEPPATLYMADSLVFDKKKKPKSAGRKRSHKKKIKIVKMSTDDSLDPVGKTSTELSKGKAAFSLLVVKNR